MRDYGKVSPQFWIGRTGKALRGNPEAQLLALYLMTSPHANMIGVYHCPIAYMAHETGLTLEGASKALQSLIDADFCTFDGVDEYVFVHQFALHQVGESLAPSDKRCKGVENELAKVPKNQCWQAFRARYAVPYNLPVPGQNASPIEAPSEALRSQKQKQEQKQNYSSPIGDGDKSADADVVDRCPQQEIIDLYHRMLPTARQVREWTPARAQALRARWREKPKRQNLGWWEKFFGYVAESDFLTGKVHTPGRKPFELSLDWLVKAENMAKVIEGAYQNEAEKVAA